MGVAGLFLGVWLIQLIFAAPSYQGGGHGFKSKLGHSMKFKTITLVAKMSGMTDDMALSAIEQNLKVIRIMILERLYTKALQLKGCYHLLGGTKLCRY